MASRLDSGTRTGWLFNYHPTTEMLEEEEALGRREGTHRAALVLLFQDHAGDIFYVNLHYNPYILVLPSEGHERDVELGLMTMFGPQLIHRIESIVKEDLDLVNHLSGRKRLFLKVIFHNVQDLTNVRNRLERMVQRNSSMTSSNAILWNQFSNVSLGDVMAKTFEGDSLYHTVDSARWVDWVLEMREYDVKYHMRVAIDLKVFCGLWYDVTVLDGEVIVARCDDSKYAPAMPRVVAFDIETTKAPLKFPQPEVDQIYMISYMLDGRGYLIVNREIVSEDIHTFEYTPRPEYEGHFETFNEPDEASTLRRFFSEMHTYKPNVYVTYNGDYFDFPFIHARALFHGMNMRNEIGFSQGADGVFLNQRIPHLDCFYWVKRDSYLPQGSQGLKAVTKAKLGYDPIEVDPEEMLPLAQTQPQRMASYSVSDAVSTWYLYLKYIHPFIYSLTTIIPMAPDDVLRKGSGGLCESLLMIQAEANNVVFPNKKEMQRERFYDGHLVDTETYIGGRVEALRSGVYRSDLPITFHMNPDTYQSLIDNLDSTLQFALEVENGVSMKEVTNLMEVREELQVKLASLRDQPHQEERPVIYHLDVGAMYPNVILTNRLQPYAIPSPDVCAGCCFNSPTNENKCKRVMSWKWRGELFTAGRYEFQRVKAQLENESFAATTIEQVNLGAHQKKAYGNHKGNVLEGTAYERRTEWRPDRTSKATHSVASKGYSGYRFESKRQQQEASEALLRRAPVSADKQNGGSDGDEDGNNTDASDDGDNGGLKAYHKLNENTQFNMIKKRLSEYSRKAYGKIHETREITRTNVVCQRENSFYVDTVRLFRDRRYEYKDAYKTWRRKLDAATDPDEVRLCKSRCVQMESLQLAHKCILNSFYGYVMRKGSRWYSIEMAGIVTYCGASLIQMARAHVQQIGITLELDTDGIWCCLPCTFPENIVIRTRDPQKPKITISYPCAMLNKMVNDRYTNHQYQDLVGPGMYKTHSECSIYFEVDGPYLAMLLPASREEGKSIKKRYAVFNLDGGLAELKGFELKRRGELMLIKDFQSQVFRRFLDGSSLAESYASAAVVANVALDMLESKGEGYETEEVLEKITESSNMTRRLSEYPANQKSLAITTARRIAEFLGPQMVKDKGLACHFIVSRLPAGRPVTERAIPVTIFRAEPAVRAYFLRKWTGDSTLPSQIDLKALLDWDYYTTRFNACVQKIITIPAALQSVPNPVPRVPYPDWLQKRIKQQNSRFRQISLSSMLNKMKAGDSVAARLKPRANDKEDMEVAAPDALPHDVEDLFGKCKKTLAKHRARRAAKEGPHSIGDSDWEDEDDARSHIDPDEGNVDFERGENDAAEEAAAQAIHEKYFAPKSKSTLDAGFFASPDTAAWIKRQRNMWIHRAKLRKELAAASVVTDPTTQLMPYNPSSPATASSHFIDMKSRALSTTWNILEVREQPDEPGMLFLVAALENSLCTFRVEVPRHVIVNLNPAASLPPSLALLPVVELMHQVLPRHQRAGRIFRVTLSAGVDGDRQLNEISIAEEVWHVYEAHITRIDHFIETVGCCANVETALHLKSLKRRPLSQRDVFNVQELCMSSSAHYLNKVSDRMAFIFHVATDTRGMLAFINRQTSTATVVFVQPAAAARPTLNWVTLREEAAKALHTPAEELTIRVESAPDLVNAWRTVRQALVAALESPLKAPVLVVLESVIATGRLLQQQALPANVPYLRILGAVEDEKLFTDPFRWTRLLGRRMLQRYYASKLWVEERVALSRLSGIPVCNLAQDSCVHALDVLYGRALHRRSHVLWNSSDPSTAFDTIEERSRDVVMAGGYTSWCVEFTLSRLDVVSILFSQMIQEGDDPNAHVLCDRGVSSHFKILRDLVADILSQAVHNSVADILLSNVTRWLRDPVSACFEPRLVETLSGLSHRALTVLLLRLAKLGGRTIKVDSTSVTVLTPKYSLQEVVNFARFITSSLQDQPMLVLLALQPVRYMCSFFVLDKRDYAGLYVDASSAEALQVLETSPAVVLGAQTNTVALQGHLRLEQVYTIYNRLPHRLKHLMMERIARVLWRLSELVEQVKRDLPHDASVALANKGDELQARVLLSFQCYLDGEMQEELIEEVAVVRESRDWYTDEEREGAVVAKAGGEKPCAVITPLWSSEALAIEYTKCVCCILELVPSNGVISKARNNCLRLCNVSPFSSQALLELDSLSTARLQSLTCSFCNAVVHLDLCAKPTVGAFVCPSCHAPIAAGGLEARLVRMVNQMVMNYVQQDFVCSKCKEMAITYISDNCCGPLVGKEKPLTNRLGAFKTIASIQGFLWLDEVVEAALVST